MREKSMSTKIAALAAVVLLSCSSGARGRAPSAPEPEGQPSAAAEAAAPAAAGNDVDQSTLIMLGACWFESPYEYMFSGAQTVSVSGRSFGSFLAGISGILYYGDLNECFGRITGSPPTSYSSSFCF